MITQHKVAFPGSNEEMAIQLPGVTNLVHIGLDYYGEVDPRLQILCYDAEDDEPKVCVRYDATGKIVEVQVWRGIEITHEDGPRTPWEIGRDGGPPREEGLEPSAAIEPPKDYSKAWTVSKWSDGKYYWHTDQGAPRGPYEEEMYAWQVLDDYHSTYYD